MHSIASLQKAPNAAFNCARCSKRVLELNVIGLVVAAHGHLAPELIAATEQILGRQKAVEQCSVDPGASAETLRHKLQDAINRADEGDGVLVMADLLGGSPCTQ